MKRVFVLTFETCDDENGRTVEGVYATAQAAADAVAQEYQDGEGRCLVPLARDLDNWDEDSPDELTYQDRELGPGHTWAISRHKVESERDREEEAMERLRQARPTPKDSELERAISEEAERLARETAIDLFLPNVDEE